MFLRVSMVTNIITILTGLVGLIHVQSGHEAGCKLINKRLWISFLILESFWLRHKTSENLFFLNFDEADWPLVKTLLE